ncbi:hypothetical protein PCL_06526 [Purpureocillium lilacinum]|uniref:Uncharacterized protein n=1 Tax=Purpureocillium lilacinum TaxID=33203 RepID=A0A2U3EMY1_PURLI|nr:hypothetical protein PCL_06526 [Purpureocillium lilacinum]
MDHGSMGVGVGTAALCMFAEEDATEETRQRQHSPELNWAGDSSMAGDRCHFRQANHSPLPARAERPNKRSDDTPSSAESTRLAVTVSFRGARPALPLEYPFETIAALPPGACSSVLVHLLFTSPRVTSIDSSCDPRRTLAPSSIPSFLFPPFTALLHVSSLRKVRQVLPRQESPATPERPPGLISRFHRQSGARSLLTLSLLPPVQYLKQLESHPFVILKSPLGQQPLPATSLSESEGFSALLNTAGTWTSQQDIRHHGFKFTRRRETSPRLLPHPPALPITSLRASGPWATISLLLLPSLYFALEQVTALHRASRVTAVPFLSAR